MKPARGSQLLFCSVSVNFFFYSVVMDVVRFEEKSNDSEEIIEVVDGEEFESPNMSEDSQSCYDNLQQTGSQVCVDNYPGRFNFDFSLDLSEVSKRHWMYSESLHKVYIDMNRVLPIQFQWDFHEVKLIGIKNLQIRALPIFANSEFQQLSIKRCPLHIMQDTFHDHKKMTHIVWCEQNDAMYEEDVKSRRHSVIVSVDNSTLCSNIKTFNVLYKFMCKSSCSMSLNRRPIYVIFTLETSQGQVLGRKKLGVKVCSCPRRDMLKEEELEKKKLSGSKIFGKRASQDNNTYTVKKIPKICNYNSDENNIFELPSMHIPGKRLFLSTLELLHGHFLGSAVREDHLIDSHPLISMLATMISQVKSENNHDNNVDSKNLLTQTNERRLL